MATKEQIIDYVKRTPENTNVNVLGSMLDGLGGSVYDTFFEGSATTVRDNPDPTLSCHGLLYQQDGTIVTLPNFTKENYPALLIEFENRKSVFLPKYSGDFNVTYAEAEKFGMSIATGEAPEEEHGQITILSSNPETFKIKIFIWS